MNKNIWILIMGFFLFQACFEIDSSNIKDSYRITQLGILEIDPGVKQGEDDSNIAYEWKIFQDGNMPNAETGKVVDDVIGKERKLNYKVTTPPGEYKLTFKATDKRNGVTEVILAHKNRIICSGRIDGYAWRFGFDRREHLGERPDCSGCGKR